MYYIVLCIHFNTVQRTVDLYRKQAEEDATSGNICMTRRRASFCGRQGMILMAKFAARRTESDEKTWTSYPARNLQVNWQLKPSLAVWLLCINGSNCLVQHVNGGTSSPSLPLGIVLIVCPGCSASTKSGGRSLWTTTLGTVSRNCHRNDT